MSSADNHRQAHITPTARKICDVFATSFNFGPRAYFVSCYCFRRALHAVFYRGDFKKSKVEQSCLAIVLSCQRSHTCCMVRLVLTPCLCFACSVCRLWLI